MKYYVLLMCLFGSLAAMQQKKEGAVNEDRERQALIGRDTSRARQCTTTTVRLGVDAAAMMAFGLVGYVVFGIQDPVVTPWGMTAASVAVLTAATDAGRTIAQRCGYCKKKRR